MEKSKHNSILHLTQAAVVTAILLVLHFTGLGYPKFGAVEMSVMFIPVAVGAVILGPAWGAFFGGVFGLTSFIMCFQGSFLGTLLIGINPFLTAVVCFIPRILMGFLCGLLFKVIYTHATGKKKQLAYVVAGISAPLFNTVFFIGSLLLFFYRDSAFIENEVIAGIAANHGVLGFAVAFVGINALIEIIAGAVLSTALTKAVHVALLKTSRR